MQQSYRDPNVGAAFKFEKLELTHNDHLSREVVVHFTVVHFVCNTSSLFPLMFEVVFVLHCSSKKGNSV